MNVSGSGVIPLAGMTAEKNVHKSDVVKLAGEVKAISQSVSRLIVNLEKLSAGSSLVDGINALEGKITKKLEDVQSCKNKLVESTYKHAEFKGHKLTELTDKLKGEGERLRGLSSSGNDIAAKMVFFSLNEQSRKN